MSHARQQIRDEIVNILTVYPVSATVVPSRIWIVQPAELPMIGVYTNAEEVSLDDGASMGGPGDLARGLTVSFDVVVQTSTGSPGADLLDTLAEEIEEALGTERQLLGVMDLLPASMDIEQTMEGDNITSRMTLNYLCIYRTEVGLPQVIT